MKLRRWHITASVFFVVHLSLLSATYGDILQSLRRGIAVWDTGKPSAADLSENDGWMLIERNKKLSTFTGDAVMTNGRVLAVFRKNNSAVEVFSIVSRGAVSRVQLRLIGPGGEKAIRLGSISVVENTRGAARLKASYVTEKGTSLTARFRLKRGEISLETEPATGTSRMRVDCAGQFVVLPDFFADDILIDAQQIPVPVVDVPSENFLLHPTGNGDAIAMCVFENREQDVKVSLTGAGQQRTVTGSEIAFGSGRKIWVALMEAPHIWHSVDVEPEDHDQVKKLDWNMPFAAQWRIDFTQTNELTDSWEMLLKDKKSKGFLKPTWMGRGAMPIGADRRRWTTVLGWFHYPCWTDHQGQGFVQPLKHKALTFDGPAIIYPVNRTEETPTDAYTVVDILRNCLGVGPCEYVLKVEGQKQQKQGRATCSSRDALKAIYEKKQQDQKHDEVEEILDDALTFVTHIRSRIAEYVNFGHEIREYLAEQRRAHPELQEFLTEMDKIAAELDSRMANRREKIRTPKYVAAMNEDFRKDLLGYQGPDAVSKLKTYTDSLTQIGGNQDELVGECRWIVRTLRQRAGIMMAVDPRCAVVAKEIRDRTQEVLLKPATYEGARH